MPDANPRRSAFDILLRIEKERSYADILIDRELSLGHLKGPDRGLLTELVYGVLRRQGTLDHIISHCSTQRIDRLERAVTLLLRIGLYQVFFLDRVPVSAAVNEAVKLAHVLAPRAAGFINAVLRRADRERDSIGYPEKGSDPGGFISAFYSNPRWITEEWIGQLGVEEAEALGKAMLAIPPFTVRVNTLKTGREELRARLTAEGITAETARYSPVALHLSSPIQLGTLPSFREGFFTVQDESSQMAAILLAPQPGEQVLDLCAAPGGKTTHLAQLMDNRGAIVACDASPRKLELVEETAARLGIAIITTAPLNAAKQLPPQEKGLYDRILVDAPCSGLGVLRRNPEGKWWKTRQNVAELVSIQKAILRNAAKCLAAGGVLLYATCSTTREENEGVIDDFLSQNRGFVLEDLHELFPAYA
ncbi:MAG TPA: 16S rRNA (cytosine(967)-C(5))-methyltransferase RsmB, partial [Geobacteraceae bacterium]|nr:16S rRNA (cytosine(967)-C(5))-methyltransferase RsmB [Geobacteraceae bacterium]